MERLAIITTRGNEDGRANLGLVHALEATRRLAAGHVRACELQG